MLIKHNDIRALISKNHITINFKPKMQANIVLDYTFILSNKFNRMFYLQKLY